MNHPGFTIRRLALTGHDVEDAELFFYSGLNVITGPSDTGKTFVFECIDFMFGASTPPKTIPEADRYDSVYLDIYDHHTKKVKTLVRSLKGGQFKLVSEGEEDRVLGEKHKAGSEDTVSQVLLELANLQDKWIRRNKKGQKRSFSFRDMAHLSVISEGDIIKNISPILSGQYTKATEEKSAYRFLLSGFDDSSIVDISYNQEIKKRSDAKEEVLMELIVNTRRKIEELQIESDLPSLREQLGKLEHSVQVCTESLNTTKESAISLENIRRTAWAKLKKVESRLDVLSELQSRFSLLREQYQSDMLRLEAIAESGNRLGEMSFDRCPVCGALTKDQDREYQECRTDPVSIAQSCESEMSRMKGLISDLELTQEDIKQEFGELSSERAQSREELNRASLRLKNHLNPRINDAINDLSKFQEKREHIQKAISIYEQLNEFEDFLNSLGNKTPDQVENSTFVGLDTYHTEAFAKAVQERLKAWKFPSLERVTFDQKDWDIIITGRSRSSHGKGVRALTHAAFTLSLLRYCIDSALPHSGIVVIDSPLVVYRQPDAGEEGFSDDVKVAFYRDLSQTYQDAQVIIIENDPPPDNLDSSGEANIIRFTGTNQGRRGFIPVPEQPDNGTL